MPATGDEELEKFTDEDGTDPVFADQRWAVRCFVRCRFVDVVANGLRVAVGPELSPTSGAEPKAWPTW